MATWMTARRAGSVCAAALCVGVTVSSCTSGHASVGARTAARDTATSQPGGSKDSGATAPKTTLPGAAGPNGAPPPKIAARDSTVTTFAPEISAREDPRSTFALDVDTASYTYAQTLIKDGRVPPGRTVRPEEFINAFAEDYPRPDDDGFSVTLDGSQMPDTHRTTGLGDMRLMRVGLRTRPDDRADRPDAALTFVIDVSGSMGTPGKLDLVRDALDTLIEQLRPTDSVAVVTFSSKATVVLPMTPASRRAQLLGTIDALRAGGSTNLAAGLVAGYRVARNGFRPGITNRVIILSDGLANTGTTSWERIVAQVRAEADKQITLLGVGVGHDYGDVLMEQLADHADGFVVYVSNRTQARQVFVTRLPATLTLRALDAKAQVTFNPATVETYRLIGYDDRALADSSFTNDHVDGGEVGAGYTVTALYAVRLVPDAYGEVAQARVHWLDPTTREPGEAANTVYVNDLDTAFDDASPRLAVCYSAAYFAEVLRGSPYGSEVSLADLADIASYAADVTGDPAVTTLADTIRRATDMVHVKG